jgi:hypothetical protein
MTLSSKALMSILHRGPGQVSAIMNLEKSDSSGFSR